MWPCSKAARFAPHGGRVLRDGGRSRAAASSRAPGKQGHEVIPLCDNQLIKPPACIRCLTRPYPFLGWLHRASPHRIQGVYKGSKPQTRKRVCATSSISTFRKRDAEARRHGVSQSQN